MKIPKINEKEAGLARFLLKKYDSRVVIYIHRSFVRLSILMLSLM